MTRWLAAIGWAVANLAVGLLAVYPIAIAVSLAAFYAGGPYAPDTNHVYATIAGRPTPFEVDTDEPPALVMILVFAALFLGGALLVVNVPARRLLPERVARWAWLVAGSCVVVPPLWYLGRWWFSA